ncbi:MAG: ABC transporter substrate-binding protein [Dehalococcoidia bacterium]|nr:ABC transporter substrate-binding protein [Dehalococcoidia bacterium]
MIRRICFTLLAVLLIASLVIIGCGPKAPISEGPIVIGYIGNVASAGTKPAMDIMQIACDEINAAGGIGGTPVKFVVEDSKGDAALSVDAATRMVLDHKALIYFVEGRTEICLAVTPKSVELYQQKPHILFYQGAMGRELTTPVMDDYNKYKFVFRDYDPEDAHYASIPATFALFKEVVGATKIAWLWEDLAWTKVWRNGLPEKNLPTWQEYAKQLYGLETVYDKPVRAKMGMYLPVLEGIAQSGADVVFFASSWFTDTDVFAKQWAESSAKDIQVCFYGGTSQTYDFWGLTGGKCLGAMGNFFEAEVPLTPDGIAWLQMCHSKGIPVQSNVITAYTDVYLIKAAIEKVGSTDVEKLIPALEGLTVKNVGIVELAGICGDRVSPFFHSRLLADPKNPTVPNPIVLPYWFSGVGQFQGEHNVVLLGTGYKSGENPPRYKGKFAEPEKYKTPAQLRQEAGK